MWEKDKDGMRYKTYVSTQTGIIWIQSARVIRGDGRYDKLWEYEVNRIANQVKVGVYPYPVNNKTMTIPGIV